MRLELQIKRGHFKWAKTEHTSKVIDVEKLFNDYWTSKEHDLTVPEVVAIGKYSCSLELQFSSQNIAESLRSSLHKLEALLKDYSKLMSKPMERSLAKLVKLGGAVSGVNPIAKAAFSVAEVTFGFLQEQNKCDQIPANLLDRLQRILSFANKAADNIVYEETDILEETIPRMFEVMQRVAQFSCSYVKRGRLGRTMSGLVYPEEIEEMDKELTKIIEDFSHALNVETLYLVVKNDQDRLLRQLSPVETDYDQKYCCMKGTRESILQRIMNWVPEPHEGSNTQQGDIFWVYGSPGIGKTSLAHSICAKLQYREQLAGVFFCRRYDANLSEPRNILPTLIYKLARTFPAFRGIVAGHLRRHPNLTPRSMKDTLFVDFIRKLRDLRRHPKQHTLVFVIDAFDECGNTQTRRDILQVLIDAGTFASWLKIIITSRPEADIIRCFSDTPEKYDLGKDEEAKVDLRTFARSQFKEVVSKRHLPSTWPEEPLLNRVISQANGLFIFINTLVLAVRQSLDPQRALKDALDSSAGAGLGSLYGLYTSILNVQVQMTHSNTVEFWRVIAVITTAQYRPLHEALVATLAGVSRSLVETLVDDLSSLLERDTGTNGRIRTRHLSISEYFVSDRCDYKGELQEAHGQLAIVCLETMVGQLRFNICKLEDSRLANADIKDLQSRIEENISEPLQYSSLYWSTHLCMTPDNNRRRMLQLRCLKEFFEELHPLFWIEVLSIMRMVPIGAPSLRRVISWVNDDESTLLEKIRDTCRFIVTFHIPIATSAPHTYISTGPFLPSQSPLSSIFSTRFSNVIKVQTGKLLSWPAPAAAWGGHTDAINCVRYSPDGCHIVTGSSDKTIRIWDVETGAVVCGPLVGHTEGIKSVAYSPDGKSIISGSEDNTIRVWDAETGAAGEHLEGHAEGVNSVAYSPDGRYIISGSNDKTLRIWGAETGTVVGEPLTGHDGYVVSVACSPDGRHIISGSLDKTIRIWDAETGAVVCGPLVGHTEGIKSVAYSPDGRYIISGSADNTIRIWDVDTGVAVREPSKCFSKLESVACSPDGRHIISVHDWAGIKLWDMETGALVPKPLMSLSLDMSSVACSPDGRHIVAGGKSFTIGIWDAETGAVVGEPLEGHLHVVNFAVCSPDGRRIISGDLGGHVRIWDARTGAVVGKPLEGWDVNNIVYSPDGRQVIAGTWTGIIQRWDLEADAPIDVPLVMRTDSMICIACSPDGRHIISGFSHQTIRIWDVETGAIVNTLHGGHTDAVTSVAYSPDGRRIISGSDDKTVRIWDAETGAVVGESLEGHTQAVMSVACSPDGRHIISGSVDHTIRIWDIATGAVAGEPLLGHENAVNSVACSPDGQHITSGSRDGIIRVWNAKSGTAVGNPLKGHTESVSSVVYSPDGQHIISGSFDKTIRIWGAVTSAAVGKSLEGPAHSMLHLTSSPHGQDIISGNDDHSTHTCDSIPHHPIQLSSDNPERVDFYVPLDPDGWARDSMNRLLYWVPPDCRAGLHSPALLTLPLTSHIRSVSLDFDDFVFGDSWTQILAAHNTGFVSIAPYARS